MKYHNIKTIIDGIRFDSRAEAEYYNTLKILKKGGEVVEFELQPKYELQPKCTYQGNPVSKITYRADFRVVYKDGHEEIVDVKGVETEAFKLKARMFKYRYPDKNLVIVKA